MSTHPTAQDILHEKLRDFRDAFVDECAMRVKVQIAMANVIEAYDDIDKWPQEINKDRLHLAIMAAKQTLQHLNQTFPEG